MDKLVEIAAAMRARLDEKDAPRRAERDANRQTRESERAAQRAQQEAARVGLVAEHAGVRLYADRIERKGESHPLPGVRARVDEHRTGQEWGGWDQRDVYLTISGPGYEWAIRTNAIWSSRKAREFAALVNGAGSSAGDVTDTADHDVAGQLERLAELHRAGAITDDEYAAGKRRVLG
jgi:hypothetical protein